MASSTKVRKYLWAAEVGTENGPHTSICTKSKEESHIVLLKEKGNSFCFAKGQTVHYLVQKFCKKGKMLLKDWSLTSEGLMQRGRVEAESVTHNYYNFSTKPKFYKNTRLAGKIIEKTSLTNFY